MESLPSEDTQYYSVYLWDCTLVGSWINDLIARGLPDDLPEPQRGQIIASGLIDAIQGGYVTQEEFA
jgi:hypothetical protein